MCGIAATIAYHYAAAPVARDALEKLSDRLAHRGPDGSAIWLAPDGRTGLAHRRLAIIDPDSRSDQPMRSSCGRYCIAFNGEIYNFLELREELIRAGMELRTRSDTEVVLESFARFGVDSVRRLRGMFAFVLVDTETETSWLVRDPYGIKPLYYADDGWTLAASSEARALVESGMASQSLDPAGITGFLLWGNVPEPFTAWDSIRSVPSGSIIRVDGAGPSAPKSYWNLTEILADPIMPMSERSPGAAFAASVAAHLTSDVPVSLFLSSGMDSTAIALRLRQLDRSREVTAITVAFPEYVGTPHDEVPLASKVAEAAGLKHEVAMMETDVSEQFLHRFLSAQDQPSIDGVNSWIISRVAHEAGFKVALSGVGGDELLGGYPTFRDAPRYMRYGGAVSRIPGVRTMARKVATRICTAFGLPVKLPGLLDLAGDIAGAYLLKRGLFLPWELGDLLPPDLLRSGLETLSWRAALRADAPRSLNQHARLVSLESRWYMRHQLLRDADWTGMAHSLEIRTPWVDSSLMEELSPKVRLGLVHKHDLFDGIDHPVAQAVLTRPKTGFTTPVSARLCELDAMSGWKRVPRLREPRQHWARRYAVGILEARGLRQ